MATGNLAAVFLFVLISTAALTLYRMFQAKDLPLLMSLPAEDGSLFLAKLSESLTYTARSMILPFPICISLISVIIIEAGSPLAAVIFAIGWIGVTLQLTGLSVIVALILGRIIASKRWGIVLRIIAVATSVVFLLIFFAAYVHQTELALLSGLTSLSILLPTSWLVAALPHSGTAINNFLYGIGFLAITIACPAAAFYLFKRRFRQLWARTTEVRQRKGKQRSVIRSASSKIHATGTTRAVILKETLVIRREPHTWLGFMILLVMFPVLILLGKDNPETQVAGIIIIPMLATASYSLSCIGREGRSFALLRSLPMRMSVLLRAKFLLGCALNLLVALAFVVALYLAKRTSLEQMWHNCLIGAITAVYLSAFGTALAAIFPKFDFTTPMRAASFPGLLILYFIALLFGATFLGIATLGWLFTPLVLVPWAGIVLILMRVGQSRLERMDV